ncbi:MAG: hypothetical protein N2045_00240 [Fimbriimonadales bacterium]|jgi:hypothetical protein|nr:hypothetical protein [Fimbriimonadales bacterium]GBC89399.1 hypothetical protein HRbin14_00121 [bacterium HR14]GIV12392.1 MAG: hypothetical protein KatS3mg021_0674 [Fimbriimonadales bacterium]CUU10972.1 hypothetical protein GBSOP10_10884 [Armatimonadetes bacterium GBS]CUU33818.1 hypothetical protein GXSOP10_10856 [Armatimonadetes bacterium GXS]
MRLKLAWEESLPADTLSFDVLTVPLKREGADKPELVSLLVTLDPQQIRFWLWEGKRFEPIRQQRHMLQRDLYCLSNGPRGRRMIYTDGSSWEWGEKTLTQDIPARRIPIGRVVDDEGTERIVCFDHDSGRPFYYVLEKPLEEDEFFIEPEEVYAGKILQSIVMSLPRLAQSFRNFYASGYRWLCRYRWSAKEPARVYGVAPDRLALLELRENRRPYNAWQLSFRSLGTPRRENALVVRTGDPKNEGRPMLLVMRATNTQVQLSAYSV